MKYITLTALNNRQVVVNMDQIAIITTQGDDTFLRVGNGTIYVKESVERVLKRIQQWEPQR